MMRSVGLERVSNSKILSATTAATGTNKVQLADQPCTQVIIHNNTGTSLAVCFCDPTTGVILAGQAELEIPDDVALPLRGITNALQVAVRRNDHSNTQVTFSYVVEGVS